MTVESWLEFSHPVGPEMPTFPGMPPPDFERVDWPVQLEGRASIMRATWIRLLTHMGTHIDAPRHIFPDGQTVDEIDAGRLISDASVIPVPMTAPRAIELTDIGDHARDVHARDVVVFDTGWSQYYGTARYHEHPFLSVDLANWLIVRGVGAVGIDTMNPDLPISMRTQSFDYPVHARLLGAEIPIIENVRTPPGQVSGRGQIIIAPLMIREGDGAPCRVWFRPNR